MNNYKIGLNFLLVCLVTDKKLSQYLNNYRFHENIILGVYSIEFWHREEGKYVITCLLMWGKPQDVYHIKSGISNSITMMIGK